MRRIEYANIKMANCWDEKNILLIVVVIIFVTKTITSEVNKINCKTNTKTGINKKIQKQTHTRQAGKSKYYIRVYLKESKRKGDKHVHRASRQANLVAWK